VETYSHRVTDRRPFTEACGRQHPSETECAHGSDVYRSELVSLSDSAETAPNETISKRFVSVDALRGFDMFLILGADAVGFALKGVAQPLPSLGT